MNIINKYDLFEKTSLPTDVLLSEPIIEITGKSNVYIENFVRISEIDDTLIIVKSKHYYILVKGNNLYIEYYDNKICIKIVGDIDEISFSRNLH